MNSRGGQWDFEALIARSECCLCRRTGNSNLALAGWSGPSQRVQGGQMPGWCALHAQKHRRGRQRSDVRFLPVHLILTISCFLFLKTNATWQGDWLLNTLVGHLIRTETQCNQCHTPRALPSEAPWMCFSNMHLWKLAHMWRCETELETGFADYHSASAPLPPSHPPALPPCLPACLPAWLHAGLPRNRNLILGLATERGCRALSRS